MCVKCVGLDSEALPVKELRDLFTNPGLCTYPTMMMMTMGEATADDPTKLGGRFHFSVIIELSSRNANN